MIRTPDRSAIRTSISAAPIWLAPRGWVYYASGVTVRDSQPIKLDVARALLLKGSVFVYLDPRHEDVRVPKWLTQRPQLVLQVGLDLPVPIPDLRVDDTGVSGTLSFNREPFACSVGWGAVFAVVGDDGMGMVWQDDLPEEIAAEVQDAFDRKTNGPRLRAIAGGASEDLSDNRAAAGSSNPSSQPPKPGLPPYLRVIK